MPILEKADKLLQILKNPKVLFYNGSYLFIISHMRSRSTLLSHILGSNDEIFGYREFHQSYQTLADLRRLRLKILFDLKDFGGKYLVDKILDNKCQIDDAILQMDNVRFIFLLREPEATIKSILDMGNITGIEWYKDINKVESYYIRRLGIMMEYSEKISSNSFYIDSDDIVNKPDRVLSELTSWLGLENKLEKTYKSFASTGKSDGAGDPSKNILAGRIIKTEKKNIDLPIDVIKRTRDIYLKSRDSFLKNINHIE